MSLANGWAEVREERGRGWFFLNGIRTMYVCPRFVGWFLNKFPVGTPLRRAWKEVDRPLWLLHFIMDRGVCEATEGLEILLHSDLRNITYLPNDLVVDRVLCDQIRRAIPLELIVDVPATLPSGSPAAETGESPARPPDEG
jgi:hypothetical protein